MDSMQEFWACQWLLTNIGETYKTQEILKAIEIAQSNCETDCNQAFVSNDVQRPHFNSCRIHTQQFVDRRYFNSVY
jgi:predicted metal-binding protein